jgi:anti-sigma-K factor RskA
VRDSAAELALGVLDGEARAETLAHIDRCAGCRTAVHELAEVADSVVLLAREAEPPRGFETRVAQGLVVSERRIRWRTARLVAVAAAAAVILSVVTVRVVDQARAPDGEPAVATVPMVGENGATVGQVDVVDSGTFASLALSVDYAVPDGAYRVVLAPDAEARRVLGSMSVSGGRGVWLGTTPQPGRGALELVDDDGATPCSARLPTG